MSNINNTNTTATTTTTNNNKAVVEAIQPVSPTNALSYFRIVGYLKNVKRTGWVNHNIENAESVAEHMYRMSMLATILTDVNLNKDRLIKICLVHDLAEAIVGDITPHDPNINADMKHTLERVSNPSIYLYE